MTKTAKWRDDRRKHIRDELLALEDARDGRANVQIQTDPTPLRVIDIADCAPKELGKLVLVEEIA